MIYVFAPGGKLPALLGQVTAIAEADPKTQRKVPGRYTKLVTTEEAWERTTHYCSPLPMSSHLEIVVMHLHCELTFLPQYRDQLSKTLVARHWGGLDSWVRLAAATDVETMPALMPPPTLELF